MSSAGSVGVRFFIAGGEVVRKTFDEIRDAGRRMWLEIASGGKSATPGIRALNQTVIEGKDAIQGLAAQTGGVGRILGTIGPYGIVAAAGIGAMILAMEQAKKVMDEGEGIFNLAVRAKQSTDAVQELRFAVQQIGGTAQDADAAMASFTNKFGGARGGFKRDMLPFQELGFSKADLQKFETADQLLGAVADKISKLSNDAEQADIADRLGIGALLPLLRQGAGAIEEMREKAHSSGGVIEADLVVRARNADEHFQALSRTISHDLVNAFGLVIPAVEKVMGWVQRLAELIAKLPGMKSSYHDTDDNVKSLGDLKSQREEVAKQLEKMRAAKVSDFAPSIDVTTGVQEDHDSYVKSTKAFIAGQVTALTKRRDDIDLAITNRENDLAKAGGFDPEAKHGKDHLRDVQGTAAAEKLAEEQQKRFNQAMAQAQQKQLQAEDDDSKTIGERLKLGLERLDDEKKARDVELARQVKATELLQVQADEIAKAEEKAREEEKNALARKSQREAVQAYAAYDQRLSSTYIELLRISEQMAVTIRDRLALQLKIYDAERASGRSGLVTSQLLNKNLTPDQKQKELAGYDASSVAGRAQILKQADGLQQTVHDAFRDGVLSGLKDGPAAALETFFGDLAKHFSEKMADNLSDKLTDVFNDLAGFVAKKLGVSFDPEGTGAATGGGIWDAIGGAVAHLFGGGRASGGGVQAGYRYRVAEHGQPELAVFGGAGQVFDPISTMKMLQPQGGGGVTVHTTFAPVYNVQGNSDDIAALRQQMAQDQAQFRSKVVATVNDAHGRGMISTKRK